MNPNRCPVVTADFEIIHRYLSGLPLEELIAQTEDIFAFLSPGEQNSYNINRFCTSYTDVDGRIQFVRTLIENAVIATVHIPFNYNRDERLINLLRPKQYEYFLPIAKELAEEGAALTDDLETPLSNITVTNPRWEHSDDARKQESPKIARVGDTVLLMIDVSGYKGNRVTFDIFDKSNDPAMRIKTVKGQRKDDTDTAVGEWVIADPNAQGDKLKLEFEGSAKSKSSGRVPIDLGATYRVELKDEEGNVLEGTKVEFTVSGQEPVVVKTNANGIAEHPVTDPSVDADVRILWEESGEDGVNDTGETTENTQVTDDEYSINLYSETGEPLVGVGVELRFDGEVVKEYTSGENGEVKVEFNAGDGEYRLHLKKEDEGGIPVKKTAQPESDKAK